MKKIHLIHVVESSKRHTWFEKLVDHLGRNTFSQSVVTLETRGELNDHLSHSAIDAFSPVSNSRVLGLIEAVRKVRRARKESYINFLILHGHRAAIVGVIAALTANLNFGVIHHVQPKYFQLLRSQKPIRGFIHQRIYRYYIRHAKIVQALSREVSESLISLGCNPERIVSIGHGVDFEEFKRSLESESNQLPLRTGFPRILMVGRLAWEKNYPLAIEVFADLCHSYPEAQLLIAGTGPLEDEIKSLLVKWDLFENVSLLGRVENVPKLMANSDLLLHLAMTESYGQVYIESCLAGLPIFTFRTGIAIDLSEESDPLVHLLSSRDPKGISDQIERFLSSSTKTSHASSLLRNDYRKHDQRVVFQEMADYLTRLVPESE
ncbi:MAG: glycosyltransferase [Candidatus Nanopelagicaceae bacterium]|nr:glycosyltransferase [Candidatus Nanopelagicaceae bacterium]